MNRAKTDDKILFIEHDLQHPMHFDHGGVHFNNVGKDVYVDSVVDTMVNFHRGPVRPLR